MMILTDRLLYRQRFVFIHLKCYRSIMVPSNVNVTEGIMSAEEKTTIDEWRKYLRSGLLP